MKNDHLRICSSKEVVIGTFIDGIQMCKQDGEKLLFANKLHLKSTVDSLKLDLSVAEYPLHK
jgi:hypothetical protein